MSSIKTKSIQILEGVQRIGSERYPIYTYHTISMNSVRRFGKSMAIIAKMSGSEQNLVNYLCETMDHENVIIHNHKLRSDFIYYMGKFDVSFTDKYVKKIFKIVANTEVLISYGKRGTYYVNPLYFCKGSDAVREKLIKYLAEKKLILYR